MTTNDPNAHPSGRDNPTNLTSYAPRHFRPRKNALALSFILLLSGFLNLFHLHQVGLNGFGNPYYAAAVQSMLTNWRHFFFLSFDFLSF